MATSFLRSSLISLALLAGCATTNLAPPATQPILPGAAPTAPFPRSVNISQGWRFVRKDVDNAQAVNFDDAGLGTVNLPHTWNVADGSNGGNDYYRGPGWYRKHLTITPEQAGKRLFLRFGAASLVADVYVNGKPVGQHRGGFAAFCFDVTDQLHAGDNVIAVRVSNAKFPDVAPLSGDFTVFGGLYRDVDLLALDPLHISPTDDASPGVYVKQSNVSAELATLDITAKLQNAGPATNATVAVSVIDHDGNSVAYVTSTSKIDANTDTDSRCRITLPRPHLWNGLADPYLYTVLVSANAGGKLKDAVAVPLGVRTVAMDSTGFLLNGKLYPLHGVNLHQEAPGRGWAALPSDQEKAYGFVQELGATAVRMAHYQHFDYEYTLCDRLGVVVWAEVPLVNRIGDDPNFASVTQQQLRELIKQQYNHPSIAFWSVFNEVSNQRDDPHWQLIRDLNDLAHALDPSRLTTGASNLQPDRPLSRWVDATAFNRYTGWYGGAASGWPYTLANDVAAVNGRARQTATKPTSQPATRPASQATTESAENLSADEIAARSAVAPSIAESTTGATAPATRRSSKPPTSRPIAISEYGAGASLYQHELSPPRPKTTGNWHPEEYQAIVHERAYAAMTARPDVWGTFVWALFDFSSDGRHEGDQPGRNDKGLVNFAHSTRKDAFYFYKANWSHEPFVYLCGRRYRPHPVGPADVKAYSNCDAVELFLNGMSLGVVKNDHGTFVWPNVPFDDKNVSTIAVAVGTKNGKTVRDEAAWLVYPGATSHPAPATQPTPRTVATQRSSTKAQKNPAPTTQPG